MIAVQQTIITMVHGIVGFVALLTVSIAVSAETAWQLEQQDDGIFIYSRPIEGSSYNAIKGTVLINVPMARVSEFVGDGNGCAKWRAMCKSSEILEAVSEHERYVYAVLDLPWPASDRDIVLHSKTEIDPQANVATVSLQSASSRHPTGDYVRAETRGQFVIQAVSEQQVEFTYIMHTELGGNLPASRVNAGLVDGTFEDLSRLRRLAEG